MPALRWIQVVSAGQPCDHTSPAWPRILAPQPALPAVIARLRAVLAYACLPPPPRSLIFLHAFLHILYASPARPVVVALDLSFPAALASLGHSPLAPRGKR
eukprot:763730-Hanusia_phi.AAC.1